MSHLATLVSPRLASSMNSCRQVTWKARCLVMVHSMSPSSTIPRMSLHTSQPVFLRKAPQARKMFGIDMWWRYIPWPSYLIKAIIRKKMNPEKLGPTEAHRKSAFHRLSILYGLLTWSALGFGVIWLCQPRVEPPPEVKRKVPYQSEIDNGGAMWWINALKTPEDMLDTRSVKIIKMSGFSYKGTEDVTLKLKEIGQEKIRQVNEESDDYFLRLRNEIPLEREGGPSNQELREQYKAEGRDFELELDYANIRNKRRTNYNADGTVGAFMDKEDYDRAKEVPQPDTVQNVMEQ